MAGTDSEHPQDGAGSDGPARERRPHGAHPDSGAPDRYVSFRGIDCDGDAERLVSALRRAMTAAGRDDPFWRYFESKLEGARGPAHDALYHVHCHLNDLRDLLARWGEDALAEHLEVLESECC